MPARDAAMDALYARFVRPGDLAFDIGSHVGDRIGAFRRLGARVVALEPQPLCARAIRAIYAGDADVTLIESACSDRAGSRDAPDQLRQSDRLHRLGRVRVGGRRRRRLGRAGLGPDHRGACNHARCPDRRAWTSGLRQDRRGGLRGDRARRPVAASGGPFLRVHHHPARRGAGLPRSASLARDLRFRRGTRREPAAHLRPLDRPSRHGRPPRRPAARGQLG